MTDTTPPSASRLENFHVTLFAIVMGLSGLTLALHAAESAYGLGSMASDLSYYVSVGVFAVISVLYAAKALIHGAAVRAEWNHPVKLAFFPAISISLLLLATASLGRSPALAEGLWAVGAALQAVLTLAVVSGWIGSRAFQHGHLSPAWFIPAVGNVIVPIAGAQLGYTELSWYFMSVGLIFWGVLLTLVFNRLVFHDPLPGRLQPTLVILIAPPAVAFVAWLRLTGEVGPFGMILHNAAYFFGLLVLLQLPRIIRLPFALSFWALSFPFAALTIACFVQADVTGSPVHKMLGTGFLGLLIVIITVLVVQTLKAIAGGKICQPE